MLGILFVFIPCGSSAMLRGSDWWPTMIVDRAISRSFRVTILADKYDPIFRSFVSADFFATRRTNLAGITAVDLDNLRNHDSECDNCETHKLHPLTTNDFIE